MTRTFKVVICNNFDNLAAENVSATVEAEYGDRCVEGSVVTLAHHGSRSGNPAPCVAEVSAETRKQMDISGWTFGVSHLDLDTIGAIAQVLGLELGWEGFWQAAAYVDVHGPHRLEEYLETSSFMLADSRDLIHDQLHAYWAWSQEHRCFAPRDGSVADITDRAMARLEILTRIFEGDETLIEAGRLWADGEKALNQASLEQVLEIGSLLVAVRAADRFCNHLYTTPKGVAACVIALNTKFKSVTVSRESDSVPVDCCRFVQALWGTDAGGHAGIAGSPRGREMTSADLQDAADRLASLLVASHR